MQSTNVPFPRISFTTALVAILFVAMWAHGGSRAPLRANDLQEEPPNNNCKMTTAFPDGSKFAEPCVMTVLPAGQVKQAPKGWVEFLSATEKAQVFSLNFFPPKEIKARVPYTVTTEIVTGAASGLEADFLNGIVQPPGARELCRMNKKFLSKGTITFTVVGKTNADYHGALEVYPACYVNLGTPQEKLIPSGGVGGGKTIVEF